MNAIPISVTRPPSSAGALSAVALCVVVAVAFLVHFNMISAPLQTEDVERFLYAQTFGDGSGELTGEGQYSEAALAETLLPALWRMFDGNVGVLRSLSLFLHVACVALFFLCLRRWLGSGATIAPPLLGGLLVAVAPTSVSLIGESHGLGVLSALLCALAATLLMLGARKSDYLSATCAAACAASAVAAHSGMVALPFAILLVDILAVEVDDREGFPSRLMLHLPVFLATLVAALLVLFGEGQPAFPALHVTLCLGVALLVKGVRLLPAPYLRRSAYVALVLLLFTLGGVSVRSALQRLDPVLALETRISDSPDPALFRALALHYLDAARTTRDPVLREGMLQSAVDVWEVGHDERGVSHRQRLLLSQAFFELGRTGQAHALLEPLLERTPFSDYGRRAAEKLARVHLDESPGQSADLFAFADRMAPLAEEDARYYGRALMLAGDVRRAASAYDAVADVPESSLDGSLKKQAYAARDIARARLEEARNRIVEDPRAAIGYVYQAESAMASGNVLRAFIWLELALRRDGNVERAWEHVGLIFARQAQQEHFVQHWGDLRPNAPETWLSLARQVSLVKAWDASHLYARQASDESGPSAEEYVAAFAVEQRELGIAETWIERATREHPDAWSPRLFKADLALLRSDAPAARQALEEARVRSAPAEEVRKRAERLDAGTNESDPSVPFEPVRSLIQ